QEWSELPGHLPLFETLLVFENYPVDSRLFKQERALQISDSRAFDRTNYPLTLVVLPGTELTLDLEYSEDVFSVETIQRLLRHFERALQGLIADPMRPLGRISLHTEAESHQLLIEWNDTQAPGAPHPCVHLWFEAQVEQKSDAVAVVSEDLQLSYGSLNR